MPLPYPDMDSCCKKLRCKNKDKVYDSCDPCQGTGNFNSETCDCEQLERPYIFVAAFSVNCNCSWSSAGWIQYRPSTDAQWFRPTLITVLQNSRNYDCDEGLWFVPGMRFTAVWKDMSTYTFGGFGQSYSTDHIQNRQLYEWDWSAVELDDMPQFTNGVNCGN